MPRTKEEIEAERIMANFRRDFQEAQKIFERAGVTTRQKQQQKQRK